MAGSIRNEGDMIPATSGAVNKAKEERIFRLLAENAQDIIFLYETVPEPRFVYVTPSVTRLTGYTPEEFYADPELHRKIIHPADRALIDDDPSGKRTVQEVLIRWMRRDGSILWTEQRLTSIFNEDGEQISVEGIVRDVSERAEAQAQIDLQVGALNAAANGIIITDTRGVIVWANEAILELTGYRPEELLRKSTRIFKSGEQDVSFYEDLWVTIASGFVWRGELVNRRKDGTTYIDEMTITPVRDSDGRVRNFVAVKQDVTSRKDFEAGIIEAKEKAEALTRLKTAILTNMSHEIRTPLTGIIGFADLLVNVLPEEQRELAERIVLSGERLMETLASVLDLAQLEGGFLKPEIDSVDVVLPARRTVEKLRHQAESSGLRVVLEVSDAGPFIAQANVLALNRILSNLLSNAIKFTREGCVGIRIDGDDCEIRISVHDTGIGIHPGFLPFIFDEYAQESAGDNREFEGAGLGLTISKRLAALIDAALTVDTVQGMGTTFTLSIPRAITRMGDAVPSARGHVTADGPANRPASKDGAR